MPASRLVYCLPLPPVSGGVRACGAGQRAQKGQNTSYGFRGAQRAGGRDGRAGGAGADCGWVAAATICDRCWGAALQQRPPEALQDAAAETK